MADSHHLWLGMILLLIHVWQSPVEIKYYSVVYFNPVTAFKALYL